MSYKNDGTYDKRKLYKNLDKLDQTLKKNCDLTTSLLAQTDDKDFLVIRQSLDSANSHITDAINTLKIILFDKE